MGAARFLRPDLGKDFTEGARQVWLVLLAENCSQTEFAERHGVDSAYLSKILYGERKPGRAIAAKFAEIGIGLALWDEPAREPFTPPGANRSSDASPDDTGTHRASDAKPTGTGDR